MERKSEERTNSIFGSRKAFNVSGLVEPEILSSDARRILVRSRRGVCQSANSVALCFVILTA
jgi:hypothetical protein